MEKHILTNDGHPDVEFTGEKIAEAGDHSHQGDRQNRWTEIDLFRTVRGKLVVQRTRRTCWQGESDSYEVRVCEDEADLINFLGHSDLAKEIYKEAEIDATLKVA